MARRPARPWVVVLALGALLVPTAPALGTSPVAAGPAARSLSWLAYQGIDNQGRDRTFLVRSDGSGERLAMPQVQGWLRHPDFSADGTMLTVDHLVEGQMDQVLVAAADGSDPRQVGDCHWPCIAHWEPSFSPDGRTLAMSTAHGPFDEETGPESYGIGLLDVASGQMTQVLRHSWREGQDHYARWSADGSRLVFWREDWDEDYRTAVFTVRVDGTDLRQLTPWSMSAGDPDWSPDGRRIVFSTRPLLGYGDGVSDLWTVRPDGSHLERLTSGTATGPRATQPRWSADGKRILYVKVPQDRSSFHVWSVDARGRGDCPVLTQRRGYFHPEQQPHPPQARSALPSC